MNQKNVKLKRRFFLFCFLLILVFGGIIWYFWPKSYVKEYERGEVVIREEFNKETAYYSYTFLFQDFSYSTVVSHQYVPKRKLVQNVEVVKQEDTTCLKFTSDSILLNPVCQKNGQQLSFHLVDEELKKEFGPQYFHSYDTVTFDSEKIKVEALLNHRYYLYNYKGFSIVTNEGIRDFPIFSKDVYDAPLITKVNKYLFIPDYDAEYYFQKVYLLDMKTGTMETWDLGETIYFDSIVLGVYEDELYLMDKHEKIEWKFQVKQKKISQVSDGKYGKVYQNAWVEKSLTKLMNEENKFTFLKDFSYQMNEGMFLSYQDYSMKFSNLKGKYIVSSSPDEVFYFVDDSLYMYSNYYGEVFLMSNFEWNFRYKNVIFID